MTSLFVPPGDSAEQQHLSRLRPVLEEIGDLKRIRSADYCGSIAERGFGTAWAGLVAGEDPRDIMRRITADALIRTRLGDLDGAKLIELGLGEGEALVVLRRGFDAVARDLDPGLREMLRLAITVEPLVGHGPPPFVAKLAAQPRAGVTCPGKPRLVLEPPENHAEHCWAVAVYGVLLAPAYGADPERVFLAGLAHHLHNAAMPDSGFTGEMLLGSHLDAVCAVATSAALAELAPGLRERIVAARAILPDAETPEGRAFHAADVVDRVMQIAQHLHGASVTMATVLDEMGLVHDGPVKPFHDRVLADMGLP